jgi:N-acetylmuramoyl-L-alanine amidase
VLDAGHGGHDAGAVSPWAREKDCNLALARRVKARLEKAGLKVVMTRNSDVFLTLGQRVKIANETPDCLFVSIHHNSGRRAAKGIETFTLAPHGTTSPFARTRRREALAGNNQDSANIALATAIHSRAIRNTGAVDRGIQRARFSVLCTITRPAVLFEGGFVSNPEEGRLITSPAYQDKLADSISHGIVNYIATIKSKPLKTRNTRSGAGSIQGGSNKYRGTTRLR